MGMKTIKGINAKVLMLDTNYIGEIKKCKVVGGSLFIGDREYFVDDINPIQLKGMFGSIPLYICKWDSLIPANFVIKSEKKMIDEKTESKIKSIGKIIRSKGNEKLFAEFRELKSVEPVFMKTKLPQLMRSTMDMRFLEQLSRYAGETKKKMDISKGMIIAFIVGTVLIFALYGMYASGGLSFLGI